MKQVFKIFLPFVFVLFCILEINAQCTSNFNNNTSNDWSTAVCAGATYTGNVTLNGVGGGGAAFDVTVDINVTITGNLLLSNTKNSTNLIIPSGVTLIVYGNLNLGSNNTNLIVSPGGSVIVTGTLTVNNASNIGGGGSISGGTLAVGGGTTCASGGCGSISFNGCTGAVCSTNNTSNTVCSTSPITTMSTSNATAACSSLAAGALTLNLSATPAGYTISKWEQSTNGGTSWTLISFTNNIPTISYTNTAVINLTTVYRATYAYSTGGTNCYAYSTTVTATIGSTPVINTQPLSQTLCAGGSANFTVAASGAALNYQWKKGGTAVSSGTGGMTASYTINPISASDAATYTVDVISTGCGNATVTSSNAVLTISNSVATAPTVSLTSNQTSVCSGATVNFTATASNTAGGAVTYTFKNSANTVLQSGSSNVYFGVFPSTETITASISISGASCLATTNATSTGVVITVNSVSAPTVSGTTSYCAGGNLSLTANSSTGGAAYSWTSPVSASSIQGLTTATITKSGLTTSDAGTYQVYAVFNNCVSPVTSTVLSVNSGVPGTPGTITGTTPVCQNQAGVSYSVPSIANAVSYLWTVPAGATITSGSTTNSIIVTFGTTAGNVTVRGTNGCGSSASASTFAVTLNPSPTTPTFTIPTSSYAAGALFTQTASSSALSTYAWTVPTPATGISNTNTATISKLSIQAQDAGTYTVVATNAGCTSTASKIITVTGGATINTSLTTLTAFSSTYGTASANQTFTVSGSNIQATGITVTAPTGFQVSISAGSGFGSSIVVGTTGTIATTTIFVRMPSINTAGSYSGTIVVSGTNAVSKNITLPSSTVSPAALTVTASVQTKAYGNTVSTTGVLSSTFTVSGLMNSETVTGVTLGYSGSPTGNLSTASIGSYTITPSTATGSISASNYTITYNTGILTVTAAPLIVTASAQSKGYGTTLALGTSLFTTSGLQNGETITSVTLTSAGAAATAAAGIYTIVPSTASGTFTASNYSITYTNGTLTVTAAPLIVTANNRSKVYGSTLALGTSLFTTSGLQNGETITSVTLTSAGAVATSAVGSYTVVPSAGSGTFTASNYSITYTNGTLSVTAAPLTVTASAQSKVYGTTLALGNSSFTTSGLQNGETITSVTLTSSGAVATAAVGSFIIVPSAAIGTFTAGNYSITYTNGTLTVTAAPLTITANNQSKCFGNTFTFAGTEFANSGILNSDAVSSVTLTSSGSAPGAGVSTYSIVPSSAVGSGLSNYSITYVNGVFTVNAFTYTWSGATNTAWGTGTNWICGTAPTASTHDVIIPNTTNQPIIPATPMAIVGSLNITGNTETLSITGAGQLQVNGSWSNAGLFIANNSAVEFAGTTAQTIAKAGGTETFYDLKINNASNTVTVGSTTNINIAGNGSLNIASGIFDAAGRNIILKSSAPVANMDQTARLSEILGTFNNATNVTVERYLPIHPSYMTTGSSPVSVTYRATMLAPAVSGVTAANWANCIKIIGGPAGSGFATPNITSYSSISSYSELSGGSSINGGWRYVLQSATPLYSGNGYRVSAGFRGLNETLSVTGTPVIGNFSKPITYSATGTQGWNLIGNPYACEIDYQKFYSINNTKIEAALYMLDPLNASTTAQNNSYYYYVPTAGPNGISTESRSTARPPASQKYIASSQAFFVKARSTSPTYNLSFAESMKANGAVYGNFRTESPDLVRLDLSDGVITDQTVVYFSAGATDTFDPDFDALKIDNTNLNISSHALTGNTDMAINGISDGNDVFIPLKIISKSAKAHSLKVVEFETNQNRILYIFDKLKNSYYALSSGFNLNFDNTGNENLNRFFITSTAKNVVTSLEDESVWARKMFLSPNPYNGGALNVVLKSSEMESVSIEISDIKGKTIKSELRKGSIQGNNTIYEIENIVGDLAAGTYIVKYKTQAEFHQQKLVIVK